MPQGEEQDDRKAPVRDARPDLRNAKLVDPASFAPRQTEEHARPDVEPKKEQSSKFDLEFNCDEGERKFGADRYYGTVQNLSDPGQKFMWDIACIDRGTPDCIPGTNVSEIDIMDSTSGHVTAKFEKGAWVVAPDDEMARYICNEVIKAYGDEISLESAHSEQITPVQQNEPASENPDPTNGTQEQDATARNIRIAALRAEEAKANDYNSTIDSDRER